MWKKFTIESLWKYEKSDKSWQNIPCVFRRNSGEIFYGYGEICISEKKKSMKFRGSTHRIIRDVESIAFFIPLSELDSLPSEK